MCPDDLDSLTPERTDDRREDGASEQGRDEERVDDAPDTRAVRPVAGAERADGPRVYG